MFDVKEFSAKEIFDMWLEKIDVPSAWGVVNPKGNITTTYNPMQDRVYFDLYAREKSARQVANYRNKNLAYVAKVMAGKATPEELESARFAGLVDGCGKTTKLYDRWQEELHGD